MQRNPNCLLIGADLYDHETFCEALKAGYPDARCDLAPDFASAVARLDRQFMDVPQYIFIDRSVPDDVVEQGVCSLRSVAQLENVSLFVLTDILNLPDRQLFEKIGIDGIMLKHKSVCDLANELHAIIHRNEPGPDNKVPEKQAKKIAWFE